MRAWQGETRGELREMIRLKLRPFAPPILSQNWLWRGSILETGWTDSLLIAHAQLGMVCASRS